MGFYIRKSFSAGPIRLNLSRSGLGASFGITGARIGVGPKGTYVHMGRGGLYYRETLAPRSRSSPHTVSVKLRQVPNQQVFEPIGSRAAVDMCEPSAVALLGELNRVKARRDLFPVVTIMGSIFLLMLVGGQTPFWMVFLAGVMLSFLALRLRHLDVTNGTACMEYSIEGAAAQSFRKLQGSFGELTACQFLWHVHSVAHTDDWKRNAGVNNLNNRKQCRTLYSLPPKVQCNISVPTLNAGNKCFYFFPDRVLIYDSGGVGAIAYSELRAEAGQTKFVEEGQIPTDAAMVGTTWRYVNKGGGPDRRFNNNAQLPVLVYGTLRLSSVSGVNELFHCSRPISAKLVASALAEYALESGQIVVQSTTPS